MLRRELLYYANKPVHLIFADGSDADWGSGDSGSIGEMTWEYFRISGWDTYLRRMSEACGRVKTEFMFLVDDEECILWSGVVQAVEFLKRYPDHACAGGRVDISRSEKQKVKLQPWGGFSRPFSLTESGAIQRVVRMVDQNRTANLYYQVHRSSIVRIFTDNASELKHEHVEVVFSSFVTSQGKWVMGSYPYWIRSGGSLEPPSPFPNFVDESNAIEMADSIILLSGGVSLEPQNTEPLVEAKKSLVGSILSSYGDNSKKNLKTANLKSQQISRGRVRNLLLEFRRWKKYLVKILVNFFPSFYEYKFPREIMRVRTYAKYYAGRSNVINDDLFNFESIWGDYQTGLTALQLEHELSKI